MPNPEPGAPSRSRRLLLGALLLGGLGVLVTFAVAGPGNLPGMISPPGPPQTKLLTDTFRRSGNQFQLLAQRRQSAPRRFNGPSCEYFQRHELYLLSWREGETSPARALKIRDLTSHGICGSAWVQAWFVGAEDASMIAAVNGDLGSGYSLTFWKVEESGATLVYQEVANRSLRVSPNGSLAISENPPGTFQLRHFPSLKSIASVTCSRGGQHIIFGEGRLTNSGRILHILNSLPAPVLTAAWMDVATDVRTPVQIKAPEGEIVDLEAVVDRPRPDSLLLRFQPMSPGSGPSRLELRSSMGSVFPDPIPADLLTQLRGTQLLDGELYRSIPDGRSQITFSTVNPAGETVPVTLRLPW